MKELKDKVAVVTGAASGIGWGLAEQCAAEGMKVVLADVEAAALKEAENILKDRGADAISVLTDVSNITDVENLAWKTLDTYGGIHLLFNNAGVQAESGAGKPLWENTSADWEWVLGVNLWGIVHGIRVFIPIMLEQKTECHVVNTASMAGLITEPRIVMYAVTKAGAIKLSEGLYLQLRQMQSKIGVSVLCPAFVDSRLDDAARNRPVSLRNPPNETGKPEQPVLSSSLRKGDWEVLSPEQCADIVFSAIREDTFYILTHQLTKNLTQQRMDNILQGRNPEIPRFD
jgi:NAD(P)-dependent dehydrogenase (short-subunit alcohol dehydrogenase family)